MFLGANRGDFGFFAGLRFADPMPVLTFCGNYAGFMYCGCFSGLRSPGRRIFFVWNRAAVTAVPGFSDFSILEE